jgi:2-dehydropantoate 2-reductase
MITFAKAERREKTSMKICVIGAGAMGSAYGGLLARAGHDVTLVDTWAEHIAAIRSSGLRLGGVMGDLEIKVNAQPTAPSGLNADVAMIWTDSNHTREAAKSARAALADEGYAITLQNGVGNVETLVEMLGEKRVAGGSSMASAAIRGPGQAVLTHMGETTIGELAGGASRCDASRIERMRAALAGAGFDVRVHPDILSVIWTKFALNCAINALSAATGLRAGEFARLPATDRLQDLLLDEILAVTQAKGITLTDPNLRASVKAQCWKKYNRPSMMQHLESGRRTEIDALNARLVEEGRRLDVPTPYNDALVCLLKGIEHKRHVIGIRTEADYTRLEADAAGEGRPAVAAGVRHPTRLSM